MKENPSRDRENGQFIESNYMAMDSQGNLYTGDTSVGRITRLVAIQEVTPPGIQT